MSTALLVATCAVSSASGEIPSLAVALLQTASPLHYTGILLAQAEEDVNRGEPDSGLQDDMDDARKALGHKDDTDAASKKPDEQDAALEQDIDRARRHLGHDGEHDGAKHDDVEDDTPRRRLSLEEEYEGDGGAETRRRLRRRRHHDDKDIGPRRRRQRSEFPLDYQRPMRDGHTKAFYMVWSIIDWSVAGGLWMGALLSGVAARSWWALANKDRQLNHEERYPHWIDPDSGGIRKRHYKRLATISTVVSMMMAVGGGLMAWRAIPNVRTYRELKAQQERELASVRTNSIEGAADRRVTKGATISAATETSFGIQAP